MTLRCLSLIAGVVAVFVSVHLPFAMAQRAGGPRSPQESP